MLRGAFYVIPMLEGGYIWNRSGGRRPLEDDIAESWLPDVGNDVFGVVASADHLEDDGLGARALAAGCER
jgi:hypothetical protein